jgi:CHAD domain-containing protein
MKRIRSAIRLARTALGRDLYGRENHQYRDIARSLSLYRDAEALIESLDGLEEWGECGGRFAGLREQLAGECREARASGAIERACTAAGDRLERAGERIAAWPLPRKRDQTARVLAAGLRRSYRRGRKRLAAVRKRRSDERLHDWRKRAKDLWYQLELLEARADEEAAELAERAHELSSLLGDDHDLVLLRAAAIARPAAFEQPGEEQALIRLIERRRKELQRDALALGRSIYAAKPRKLVKRLGLAPPRRRRSRSSPGAWWSSIRRRRRNMARRLASPSRRSSSRGAARD